MSTYTGDSSEASTSRLDSIKSCLGTARSSECSRQPRSISIQTSDVPSKQYVGLHASSTVFRRTKSVVLSPDRVQKIGVTHAKQVIRLIDTNTTKLFGDVDVKAYLYEKPTSLGVYNDDDELVGVMCMDSFPNVPAIPSWSWSEWFSTVYKLENMYSHNSLWIHLLAYDKRYMTIFLKVMLQYKFKKTKSLKYVLLMVPPGIDSLDYIGDLATMVLPEGHTVARKVQTVYLFMRERFTLRYKIRRAVEEDNDDLVPLIGEYSSRFKKLYGEFYIAELLATHQDSGRQLIVAEYAGYACGLVCLNETVNYDVLNKEFELLPYNGLKKPCLESDSSLFGEGLEEELDEYRKRQRSERESCNYVPADRRLSENYVGQSVARISIASSRSLNQHGESDDDSIDEEDDDYSIVNVSSTALLDIMRDSADNMLTPSHSVSDFSINAQFNELCTQMLNQRAKPKRESGEMESKNTKCINSMLNLLPEYRGEDNAFSLELAVAHTEHPQCIDLLVEAAFECFTDRDYCVMTIPPCAYSTDVSRNFVWVPHRPFGTFPHELLVLHRNAISGKMRVRVCLPEDRLKVEFFLMNQARPGLAMAQVDDALSSENSDYVAFMFLCEDTVIGLSVISEDVDIDYLYYRYEFHPYIDHTMHKSGCYGIIETVIVSPIFQVHSNYFLRELHRLCDLPLLFYKLKPGEVLSDNAMDRPIMNLLYYMMPLFPRPIPQYDPQSLEECMPDENVIKPGPAFALYMSTPRVANKKRYFIRYRIVVVGSSETAISFLETLCCTYEATCVPIFVNVTLICPHGLPYQKTPKRLKQMFFVHNGYLDERHMDQYNLRAYVNVVQAVMTGIDRKNKTVMLNDESYLPYDLLFLACGEQFQRPPIAMTDPTSGTKKKDLYPTNVFLINSYNDTTMCLSRLKSEKNNFNKELPIIIYGHYLEAYCTLAALMEGGFLGKQLILVEPFPDQFCDTEAEHLNVSLTNDGEIDDALIDIMLQLEIKVYESYRLVDWNYNKDKNLITSVQFESKYRFLEIECQACFVFDSKCISQRTFMAIIRAGLVFDGHLVIDTKCHTNDPNIYGCGTITKYSRKYYADDMSHRYFNSAEVGKALGNQIRRMLIPTGKVVEKKIKKKGKIVMEESLVPKYKEPIVTYCMLPGKLYYFQVRKPGKVVPLGTAMATEDKGMVLITGKPKNLSRQGYFRLYINQYHTVECITCLSKEPIDVHNLKLLYGKHEKLLNNMVRRFEKMKILDLFQYFKEPWSYAIYHDHFPGLMDRIRKLCNIRRVDLDGEFDTLPRILIAKLEANNWLPLAQKEEELQEAFEQSYVYKEMEQLLLDYLQTDYAHLPMYAQPMFIRLFLQEYQLSPMFLPQ